jgi:hypothetical protein
MGEACHSERSEVTEPQATGLKSSVMFADGYPAGSFSRDGGIRMTGRGSLLVIREHP